MDEHSKPRRTWYAGRRFRSWLESLWARAMDVAGVRWRYEPTRFWFGGDHSYLPDFYLPAHGLFLEVKPVGPSPIEFAQCQTLFEHLGGGVGFLIGYPPGGCFLRGRSEAMKGLDRPAVLFYREPLPWES